jgi:hypothetical protein
MTRNIKQSVTAAIAPEAVTDREGGLDSAANMSRSVDDPVVASERGRRQTPAIASGGKAKGKRRRNRSLRYSQGMSLETMAKEYIWLWDVRHGISVNALAMREGVTVRRVQFGVSRARAQENGCRAETAVRPPRLVPLFPIGSYTPQSACRHRQPLERGSLFCCVVCHCTGIDDHPALQRDPLTDPAPEPKLASPQKRTRRETRKERRQRLFAKESQAIALS